MLLMAMSLMAILLMVMRPGAMNLMAILLMAMSKTSTFTDFPRISNCLMAAGR